MNVQTIIGPSLEHSTPLLVLPFLVEEDRDQGVFSAADGLLGGGLSRVWDSGDFNGKAEKTLLLFPPAGTGAQRVLLVGLGRVEELDAEVIRRVAGAVVRVAEGLKLTQLAFHLDRSWGLGLEELAQAVVEGATLAAWSFKELKGAEEDEKEKEVEVSDLSLLLDEEDSEVQTGARIGLALARGENVARTLQERPGNLATPEHLAREATSMAKAFGLKVSVMGPKEMEKEKMGALLAVAQGSSQEPRLIVLEHRGGAKEDAPLVLVGKGLTFDAGGISIKPALGMEEMKYDMSGGAAVLGALQAVAELEIPLNVIGIVPSSENLLNGSAVKPGDVITTREGKTVEVLNTDAEGRLILSDALSYGQDFKPAAMVDCATLTGACVIALGEVATAVLGSDDALVQELRQAGERSGERCWPLPLWDEYGKQLESDTADLKNVGGRAAGTITAAYFLSEFVGETKWAHLDVAGTAYGDGKLPYHRKGGYGFPARLLIEWVRGRAG
jgi:leucyl aminopeptidase